MNTYDNSNRGSIWKNDRKTTETHPDYSGTINVEGKEYWLSAWKRRDDASAKAPILSFSVQPKEAQAAKPAAPVTAEDFDDVPF
tara:strand:+ start:626 stop:877 length:252 start_codon:yes stop_codon:yes gene_type:complete